MNKGLHELFLETATVIAVVIAPLAHATTCLANPANLPRYELHLGDEIVYRTVDDKSEWDNKSGGKDSNLNVTEWTLVVVRLNDDGSWRLVFTEMIGGTYVREGAERVEAFYKDGYFDVRANLGLIENATIQHEADPSILFPPLPLGSTSGGTTWTSKLKLNDTRREFMIPAGTAEFNTSTDKSLNFAERMRQGDLDELFRQSERREYEFDLGRHLIRRVKIVTDREASRDGPASSYTTTVELRSTRALSANDLLAIQDDVFRYLPVSEEYDGLVERDLEDVKRTSAILDQAVEPLKALIPTLKSSSVRRMVERKLAKHDRNRSFTIDQAEAYAAQLDKPAANWRTIDVDGVRRTLNDYRGRVVLLDFWYSGCGSCLDAMPQIKEIAADFAGKSVTVLGVNADRDIQDAKDVIAKRELNYGTLLNECDGEKMSDKYQVKSWPTLILIDREGVIRHIHVGCTPTLRQDIGEKLRLLLR